VEDLLRRLDRRSLRASRPDRAGCATRAGVAGRSTRETQLQGHGTRRRLSIHARGEAKRRALATAARPGRSGPGSEAFVAVHTTANPGGRVGPHRVHRIPGRRSSGAPGCARTPDRRARCSDHSWRMPISAASRRACDSSAPQRLGRRRHRHRPPAQGTEASAATRASRRHPSRRRRRTPGRPGRPRVGDTLRGSAPHRSMLARGSERREGPEIS